MSSGSRGEFWLWPSRSPCLPWRRRRVDDAANSGKGPLHEAGDGGPRRQQTNLTKPEAPPPQKKETGPVLTVDQFVAVKQAGHDRQLVDAQISKMTPPHPGDRRTTIPQKPDFLFRLGELYAEKQRYYFGKARALDQKIFDDAAEPDAARC